MHTDYSEKKKYENLVVMLKIYLRSLTHVKVKYMYFCVYQWKWSTDFLFKNCDFETLKKFESIIFFVTFINIWCQSKESSLSKQDVL